VLPFAVAAARESSQRRGSTRLLVTAPLNHRVSHDGRVQSLALGRPFEEFARDLRRQLQDRLPHVDRTLCHGDGAENRLKHRFVPRAGRRDGGKPGQLRER
jgi:hypothetical protein